MLSEKCTEKWNFTLGKIGKFWDKGILYFFTENPIFFSEGTTLRCLIVGQHYIIHVTINMFYLGFDSMHLEPPWGIDEKVDCSPWQQHLEHGN